MADDELSIIDSGTYYTPESAKMKRRLAEAMMKAGMETTPIQSHWQGLAKIANAMFGGYMAHKLEQDEKAQNSIAGQTNTARYGLEQPSLSTAPGAPQPPAPPKGAGLDAPAATPSDFMSWVQQKEGFKAKPYKDYSQTSIGFGTKAQPGDENGITREEALRRLGVEMGQARQMVQGWAKDNGVNLSPKQEDAITDLTFNSGTAWMNQGIAAAMRSGKWDVAQRLFEQYVNAGGQPLEALRTRRRELSPWLLDQSTRVAQATTPGVVSDMPQSIPGVVVDGGMPGAAPPAAPQAVPAPAAPPGPPPVAAPPGLPQGVPGAPPANPQPTVQLPPVGQVAAPALTETQIIEAAKASLGNGRAAVEAMLRHPNPAIRAQAEKLIEGAIARIRANQMPTAPMDQAKLAESLSKTRENEAQLPKHQADARKANAEAREQEIKNMSLRTPEQNYARALQALNTAASYPERFGRFAFERALGPYVGANISGIDDKSWNVNPVDWIGKAIGSAGNALSHLTEGGAAPGEIQSMVGGLQSELGQMIRKANGMSAKEGDSNVELQNFLRMVGNLGTATSIEDYQRRLADVNERFARMMGQEPQALKADAVKAEQRADSAVPLHRQAMEAAGISAPQEGTVITNRQTGQRMIMRGGQWQPL